MYSTVQEVLNMIKPDIINTIIGEKKYFDETERLEKMQGITEDAINDADAEIDGYLIKRYPTPLIKAPLVINKMSKDIALYNIFSRNGMIDKTDRESNYMTRYRNAIKYLENVAKGLVDIDTGSSSQGSSVKTFTINSNQKTFGRNSLKGF